MSNGRCDERQQADQNPLGESYEPKGSGVGGTVGTIADNPPILVGAPGAVERAKNGA